nr:uncharacterized protein LOC110372132 isoform X5 [Helicoverpa armigera]XP_049700098.1 uncharacterized protein LOC110372132 isoform X5 [Helicoverpa armigera]
MDWPVWKKCCFCIPLRYGLLTWGYLKLISASIVLSFFIFILVGLADYIRNDTLVIVIPIIAIMVTDIGLHILCIVGAHKKNVKLLQIYYIYHIVLWVLTLISLIVMGFVMMKGIHGRMVLQINFFNIFLSSVLQSYFLLLLRSQIMKLKTNIDFQYLNTTAETGPKCTMQYGTAIYALEGSQDVYNV